MNLILLGAPGAGKGTQAEVISETLKIPTISTGNMIREALKSGTEMGRKAKEYVDAGKLVPDEVVIGIIKERLAQPDCADGFILDGFPRTIHQADLLGEALRELNNPLDRVIYFKVDDELLLQRLTARQNCRKCGEIYNKLFMPSKVEGVCDKCGGELFQRPDDSLETAKSRLEVFYKQTQPLIDYYEKQGLLLTVTETDKDKIVAALEQELA